MSRANLFTMSSGRFTAFKKQLHDAGLTPELITRLLKEATPRQMREWVRDCPPGRRARFTYDAAKVLYFRGRGPRSDEFPEAEPGEMVIYYGGWSFKELYNNAIVLKEGLLSPNWRQSDELWIEESLAPGWYRLRLRIPGNRASRFENRTGDLLPGEKVAPPCLVGTGLVTHRLVAGQWLVEHSVGSAISDGTISFHRRHNWSSLQVENGTHCSDMTGYRLIADAS